MEKLWELMFPKHEGAPRRSDGAMILEEQRCSSIRVVQNSRSCDPVASYGLRKMVTYVNLKNAATDPESDAAGRNYRLVIPWGAESLTDGLSHETRRIASRLTFEFQFDARDSRSPSDNRLLSSTMRACYGKECWGLFMVVIRGSITQVSQSDA